MDLATLLPLSMFPVLFCFIMLGYPVAFTLGGVALLIGLIGVSSDLFLISDFGFIPSKVFGIIQNVTLLAVPLFIFMGVTLEKSGVAEQLLLTVDKLCRKVNAGLPVALVAVGALLAASTGIVGATVVTMGVLSLPVLLARGYSKELACGTIAASGTLGQVIPPSIVLILLGDMMNVAVADLFAGALIPGLLLVVLYMLYTLIVVRLRPPQVLHSRPDTLDSDVDLTPIEIVSSVLPPTLLILLVLGSILFGVASPTESAGCGAAGALVLAVLKGRCTWSNIQSVLMQTTHMTSMVFTLLIGAQFFSVVFRGMYGDEIIVDYITGLSFSPDLVLLVVLFLMFLLGFFLDFIEICFIVVPILGPILTGELNMDPVWVAILFAVNLQTSFLTPPFGFALFYLKGVAPVEVTTAHIFRGVVPFVFIQIVALGILLLFPPLVTWLPTYLFGTSSL
jgi:tripartite ATP-independent transporter DctM subunit